MSVNAQSLVTLSANDAADGSARAPADARQFVLTQMGVGSDEGDIGLGEIGPGVIGASYCAALLKHILHVGRLRSEEQVIGVYAGANVALVADEQTRRDRAVVQNPRRPVCAERDAFGKRKPSVPGALKAGGPDPAPAVIYPELIHETIHGSGWGLPEPPRAPLLVVRAAKPARAVGAAAAFKRASFSDKASASHRASPKAGWSGLGHPLMTDGRGRYSTAGSLQNSGDDPWQ